MYHNSGFSMFFGSDADMYSSPSAAVDCTLSLGTPSTRATHEPHRPSAFGWNVPPPPAKPRRGEDPLLARRCANCDTTSTPLWRNGPRGPKSLCNACGIRFKKEERRATAAAAGGEHGSWAPSQKAACYPSTYGSEFRFVEDDGRDSEFMSWRFNVADRPGILHDFTR